MPDQTARDAVASAIKKAREFRFAQAWRTEDGEVYGERRQASDEETVDAVLAALGIPPDTTTDEVRAGLAALRMAEDSLSIWPTSVDARTRGYHEYIAEAGAFARGGASPAAAIHALNAKLEEADRA